jgi:SAM-dependent methyltransferase
LTIADPSDNLSKTFYTREFYEQGQVSSLRAAREVIPIVLELFRPRSVIDVGCGVGPWLAVFKEYGIEDILGVDGDYVDRSMLQIPETQFISFDLEQPFETGRQFDLVVSLEVAEHLPRESAKTFVDSLTKLGPIILFSAAMPFQGGTHHVNEQWPEYWAEYFREKGYIVVDCIRSKIWRNENVSWWYSQNILVFAKPTQLERHPLLAREVERTFVSQLSIVHPCNYLAKVESLNPSNLKLKKLLSLLAEVAWYRFIRMVRRLRSW